ncbi:Hsp20/alpha crystallin family protein [Planosporangium thailandense]|uniref:Hsp20/alpha crystallin family protein n=1 Tax=Planosporangium thailandense TaxID=765197 RepID=A0ABX0XX72_9ACTN|nr:Hsp20/alpha crystallin family protein [Planosporangium thailandense]NJC70507.1 Hsp20/alpha crystallin family protein [Planosporangium thailandense]
MTSLAPRRGRQLTEQRRGGRGVADPLTDLQSRMGDLLQSFFGDPFLSAPLAPAVVPIWVPPFDIEETQDSYVMEMDLPGVRPEDVNIELIDSNTLRITGRYTTREHSGTMRREERRGGGGGEFEYDVGLPGDINAEKIDATLEHGVLTVHAGKAQPQARRIPVKAGGEAGTISGQTTESQTRVSPGTEPGAKK